MNRIQKLPASVLNTSKTVNDRRAVLEYLAVTNGKTENLTGKFTVVRPSVAKAYYVTGGSPEDNQTVAELIQSGG